MGMSSFQFADRQELRSCFLNRRMRQENGGGKGMGRPSLGKKSEFGTHSTVSSLAFLSDRSVLVGLKNGCVEHWAPEGDSFLPVPGEIQWKRNISIQRLFSLSYSFFYLFPDHYSALFLPIPIRTYQTSHLLYCKPAGRYVCLWFS